MQWLMSGGCTTGISILREGYVIFSANEPTSGNHMTLVLSVALGISFADAEEMQRAPEHEEQVFAIVRPVAEKMAHLASRWLAHYPADVIYLVGGVSSFYQFADIFRKTTGKRVIQAAHPLLVTPLGIAMHSR